MTEPTLDESALKEMQQEIHRRLLEVQGFPRGSYHNPTEESLAAEVAAEAQVQDEMAAEYEAGRVQDMVDELRGLGYTVEKGGD